MLTNTLVVVLTAALAVQAAPHNKRQGVTALISSGTAPPGCKTVSTSLFGIGIHKATDVPKASTFAKRDVATVATQAGDGQPAAATSLAVLTQAGDGQPAAATSMPVAVSQISDGQIQAPTKTMTMIGVSQIGDGQVQAHYSTATAVTVKSDGQPQVPTGAPISQKTDGQPQVTATASAGGVQSDGQITGSATGTASASASTPTMQMVACKNNSTLSLTIENGVLYDGQRRQGYIADNYQFQFDAGVPQTGAIITAGFSLCSNGSLALGGSTIFWQCLSGTFYNLYDRDWAFQCEPVYLTALELITCPA